MSLLSKRRFEQLGPDVQLIMNSLIKIYTEKLNHHSDREVENPDQYFPYFSPKIYVVRTH